MFPTKNLPRYIRTFSHWSKIPLAPKDAILGLNEAFNADKRPQKVNLGVGAYRGNDGKPYILSSVKIAEDRVISKAGGHEYAGIAGVQSYIDHSLQFAYGNIPELTSGKIAAIQTLSGTGACRVAGEFLSRFVGKGKHIFMPDPTWGNHIPIMRDSGLVPSQYRYFDRKTCGLDFRGMAEDLESAPPGSLFLLHACAHNPTGCDPTHAQWDALSALALRKQHLLFFDCAYQGFATGDSELDAYSIRKFVADGHKIILAQSFAKNFGLYGERIGTLSVVTASAQEAEAVNSQLKTLVRPMYSNPPIHGARIVAEILGDENLRNLWSGECKGMSERIQHMRSLLREELESLEPSGSEASWSHVTTQIGMFCFTGLSQQQVAAMVAQHGVYCTADGRISMAGVTPANAKYVAKVMHTVKKTVS